MALAVVARDTFPFRRSAARGMVLLAAAVGLALLHLPGRPRTLCTLRTLCGVPCPMCGGTTAAVRVGRGDVLGAVRASPLAVIGASCFVLGPLVQRRPTLSQRNLWLLILTVAAASELYQLARFGLL